MEARWKRGVWLGKRFNNEEHIVGTHEGKVARSAAVRIHPTTKWDWDLFNNLKGVPWDPTGERKDGEEAVSAERLGDLPKMVQGRTEPNMFIPQVRRVWISRAFLEKFGYSPGCPKCIAIQAGDETQPSLGHNPSCRSRIEKHLEEDPILKKKIESAQTRKEERKSRKLERDEETERQRARKSHRVAEEELQSRPASVTETRTPDQSETPREPG